MALPVFEKVPQSSRMHYPSVKAHIGGRTKSDETYVTVDSPYWDARQYQWPGTYFEGRFNGGTVFLKFDDSANILQISVDGQTVATLNKPGLREYKISGLKATAHVVRVERLTETQDAVGAFLGFAVPPGGKALPAPAPRARQIEFIGDSYTSGYGNTSTKRECTQDEVWATTDTQQAFGPQTAKHYKADYQINSFSGIGIVRGYDGGKGPQMPARYAFSLLDGPALYSDTSWNPQIVVIALGGNDFSTPVHANEKWTTQEELRADYIASYVAFVKQVRATHPTASFVLMAYGEDEVIADTAEVMKRLNAGGETRVATFSVGKGFELTGCDWHLNLNDDKRITDSLIGYFDAHPDLWQGK